LPSSADVGSSKTIAMPTQPPAPDDWFARTVVTPVDRVGQAPPPPPASPVPATVAASVPREAPPSDWAAISMAASVPMPPTKSAAYMPADFSVFGPNLVQAGRNFVVEVWVAPTEFRDLMLAEATRSGRMVERGNRSLINLADDALITVILKLPD